MAQFLLTEPKRNRNKQKTIFLYPAVIIVRLFDLVKIKKKKHLSAYPR